MAQRSPISMAIYMTGLLPTLLVSTHSASSMLPLRWQSGSGSGTVRYFWNHNNTLSLSRLQMPPEGTFTVG